MQQSPKGSRLTVTAGYTPWYTTGTQDRSVCGIVLHDTVTDGPVSPASQRSYHYTVARSGEVIQTVDLDDYAWHVGTVTAWPWWLPASQNPKVSAVNIWTVGIELETTQWGLLQGPAYTLEQYQSLAEVIQSLWDKYGVIPVVGHSAFDQVTRDPVGFDWTHIPQPQSRHSRRVTPQDFDVLHQVGLIHPHLKLALARHAESPVTSLQITYKDGTILHLFDKVTEYLQWSEGRLIPLGLQDDQ